jgi:hypothetical protein
MLSVDRLQQPEISHEFVCGNGAIAKWVLSSYNVVVTSRFTSFSAVASVLFGKSSIRFDMNRRGGIRGDRFRLVEYFGMSIHASIKIVCIALPLEALPRDI